MFLDKLQAYASFTILGVLILLLTQSSSHSIPLIPVTQIIYPLIGGLALISVILAFLSDYDIVLRALAKFTILYAIFYFTHSDFPFEISLHTVKVVSTIYSITCIGGGVWFVVKKLIL